MNCTCRGQLRDRCAECQASLAEARRRLSDNALMAIARDWVTFPDHTWPHVLYRHEVDDLHRLLEEPTS